MRPLLTILSILLAGAAHAEDAAKPAAPAPAPAPAPAAKPIGAPKNPESVDISGLEEDYWRPNKDELEVVQNRRYEKAHRWELGLSYGIFQGQDYVTSKSVGGSLAYNFTNQVFVEASYIKINNSPNDLLNSVQQQYGFTPNFNTESRQEVLAVGWTPIYAKFALLSHEISHFEMYFAPGVGITRTVDDHVSEHFTIGQKFFLTEHLLFRLDWRISHFTDHVNVTTGSAAVSHGGPGYLEPTYTTHNIMFGFGVMF